MNQSEFVAALLTTHDRWNWKLVGEGQKQLRGTHKETGHAFCPIDVVGSRRHGNFREDAVANAQLLGLSEADRVEIQSASDGTLGNPALRKRLLAVAGV